LPVYSKPESGGYWEFDDPDRVRYSRRGVNEYLERIPGVFINVRTNLVGRDSGARELPNV
jgi:hypothetical protein